MTFHSHRAESLTPWTVEWIFSFKIEESRDVVHRHTRDWNIHSYGIRIHFNSEWNIRSCHFKWRYFHSLRISFYFERISLHLSILDTRYTRNTSESPVTAFTSLTNGIRIKVTLSGKTWFPVVLGVRRVGQEQRSIEVYLHDIVVFSACRRSQRGLCLSLTPNKYNAIHERIRCHCPLAPCEFRISREITRRSRIS